MSLSLAEQLQRAIDQKTKPPGSLGMLEALAMQAGLVQQSLQPTISHPHLLVFAGDHGIAATGLVNPYPQAVTAQMVLNFVQGGAAINVFCRQHSVELVVADAGVAFDFNPELPIRHLKVAMGTANYLNGDAMTPEQLNQAMSNGAALVAEIAARGCNTIGFGEMGIGNTSSAALLMHAITGLPLATCVGRGTGSSDAQLVTKRQTLEQVALRHELHQTHWAAETLLQRVGGFEIAMMTGAYLAAAENRMLVVVDGFISTAALLCAHRLQPHVLRHCVFAHCSQEQGHKAMLQYLGVTPLLQLHLRLGEGTGAALAMPLLQSAVAFLREMASFDAAGVSKPLADA